MAAKLYKVKDKYTGLKNCSTQRPLSGDYQYAGMLRANSMENIYSQLNIVSSEYRHRFGSPLQPGDIVVMSGSAYMTLGSGWIQVPFDEKDALI